MITKNKDTDFIIMMKLDDKSLLNYCLTDKSGKKLCDNEDFWRNRTHKIYGDVEKNPNRNNTSK